MDKKLLDKLRCPVSGSPLVYHENHLISTNADMRYRYKVQDNIPLLMKEEADQLTPDAWELIVKQQAG